MFTMAGILGASSASAATSIAGDLFLGFRVSGGTGAGTDLVVRAGAAGPAGGNAINFRDAVANIANVVDVNAELTAVYGAGWHTRADLFWGVVGARSGGTQAAGSGTNGNVPSRSPFIGIAQASSTPGEQNSTAPNISSSTLRANTASSIAALRTGVFAGTDTGVSAAEAVTGSSSAIGSYTERQSTFFGLAGGTEVANASGIDNTGLDLYWIVDQTTGALDNGSPVTTTGAGIWQGSFQINNSGIVSFTVAAVPEPSRALLAGLGLAGIAFRRRRSTQKIA
jgi:hypothetical protein